MTASPILLNDAAMRRFIIEGYLVMRPDFPSGFHERIYDQLENSIDSCENVAHILEAIVLKHG